jgi:hypothetical protein
MFNNLFGNSSLKEKIKKLETQLQEATAEASFWKERYNQYKDEQENLDTIKTIKDKEQIIADLEAENAELTNAAKYWKDESDYWQRNHNTIRDAYIKENHHMSYDVRLIDHTTHKVLEAENPHFMQGGTFCPGGTKELWLNITYNYAAMLCKVLQRDVIDQDTGKRTTLVGLDAINGIYAAETISMLRKAINSLSDDGANENYWHPTEGNVKKALIQLKALADMRPDGVWEVI